jgi:phosphomannomutase/phosphoglucomutase
MSDPWKPCDIRGTFPDEVSADLLSRVGASVGTLLPVGARVLVAGDFRTSTPLLKAALIEGLQQAGTCVLDAGQIPTSIAYFAHLQLKTAAVVIVTASHNPPEYNGLKLMIGQMPPTPEEIRRLRAQAQQGGFRRQAGKVEVVDLVSAYRAHTLDRWSSLVGPDGMPLVLDAGNGAWSELAPELFAALGFRVHPLFCKIDGTFSNRFPDCARSSSLSALRKEVMRTGAQLGVAWDGDGDRVAFVDSSASVVSTDEVSALMIRELMTRNQGAKVIYDVKLSDLVRRTVTDCGGDPIMERSGHTFIKRSMIMQNALFGCEVSGHYFFRELAGGDDGLFAALFMTELIAESGLPLLELRRTLPPFYVTPDLRIPARVLAFTEIAARLRSLFPNAQELNLDGVRLETPEGFVLVRESVTEPVITMRLEGRSQDSLRHLINLSLKAFPEAAREISQQIDDMSKA